MKKSFPSSLCRREKQKFICNLYVHANKNLLIDSGFIGKLRTIFFSVSKLSALKKKIVVYEKSENNTQTIIKENVYCLLH